MAKPLPKIENFKTTDGNSELRTLFAVAVFRALDPREKKDVMNCLGLTEKPTVILEPDYEEQRLNAVRRVDQVIEDTVLRN